MNQGEIAPLPISEALLEGAEPVKTLTRLSRRALPMWPEIA
jgi:hypothetical protein